MRTSKFVVLPRAISFVLIYALILNPALSVVAQDACEKQLSDAEQKYYSGRFDEAIETATRCLSSSSITEAEKLRAYKLIGLSYIAKDYLEQARSAVQKLLELVPTYEPDPDQDPPPFTNMVKEIKEKLEQAKKKQEQAKEQVVAKEPVVQVPPEKKGGGKTWLYIGGGVAVGLVAVLAAGKKGGDGGTPPPALLPEPPAPPNQ